MTKSNTKIDKQIQRKTNDELVETIILAKKQKEWINVAEVLSGPRRKRINVSLKELNTLAKVGEKIVVPGKILSQGEITKKIEVIAFSFSEKAETKLKEAGCKTLNLIQEIKLNPSAKGIRFYNQK